MNEAETLNAVIDAVVYLLRCELARLPNWDEGEHWECRTKTAILKRLREEVQRCT